MMLPVADFFSQLQLPHSRQRRRGMRPRTALSLASLVSILAIAKGVSSFIHAAAPLARSKSLFAEVWQNGSEDQRVTPSSKPQRVAIVGSGAVGCYYGARLWEVGHSVDFLMRGEHYEFCRRNGLHVSSIEGNLHIPAAKLSVHQSTTEMRPVDWILVALKSTSLSAIPDLIEPLLGPETRVLAVMNGLIEDDLIRMLKEKMGESDDGSALTCCKALYGGMAFLCSNRVAPGQIRHTSAGLLSSGVACSTSEDPWEDQLAFNGLWESTKVPVSYDSSLLRGRWMKMVWNLPFNGLSCAMGGITVDKIVQDPSLRRIADGIMDETIAIGNADLERVYGKDGFEPLGKHIKSAMMGLSDSMGPYKTSTMLDLTNRRPMEVRYLFQVPVERSRMLGVPAKHLETVVAQIEAFQRMYDL